MLIIDHNTLTLDECNKFFGESREKEFSAEFAFKYRKLFYAFTNDPIVRVLTYVPTHMTYDSPIPRYIEYPVNSYAFGSIDELIDRLATVKGKVVFHSITKFTHVLSPSFEPSTGFLIRFAVIEDE